MDSKDATTGERGFEASFVHPGTVKVAQKKGPVEPSPSQEVGRMQSEGGTGVECILMANTDNYTRARRQSISARSDAYYEMLLEQQQKLREQNLKANESEGSTCT